MTKLDAVTTVPSSAQVIADVAREQRREWAERVLDGHDTLWLERATDLAAALDADRVPAAVGWLEGIEQAESLELVERLLRAVVERGAAVLVVVPNTRLDAAFGSGGLVLGWDEAHTLATALGVEPVGQHLAEAAVIGEPGDGELAGTLVGASPESDDACAWLLVAGAEPGAVATRVRLSAQPVHRAYLAALQTANAELERANVRLARANLGRHDAGAASVLGRIEAAAADRDAELAQAREAIAALEDRLAVEVQVAAQNDRFFQDARGQLNRPEHRMVTAVITRLRGIPGGRIALRLVRKLLRL